MVKQEERTIGGEVVTRVEMTKTIIECRIDADTPIDWRQVQWTNDDNYTGPKLQYTSIEPGAGDDALTQNAIEQLLGHKFSMPVNTKQFTIPKTLGSSDGSINPYVFEGWEVPREGQYRVTMSATFSGTDGEYTDDLTLCVKKRSHGGGFIADSIKKEVLAKKIDGTNGGLGNNESLTLDTDVLELTESDDLYFIIAASHTIGLDFDVKVEYNILSINPWVDEAIWVEIPVEYIVYKSSSPQEDIVFAGGFRNWYYGRWNADEFVDEEVQANQDYIYDYELQNIKSGYLHVNYNDAINDPEGFATKIQVCSPMVPKIYDELGDGVQQLQQKKEQQACLPCWQGMDTDSFYSTKS
jgi:hypothetical protein